MKICPLTNKPVIYLTCNECEHKGQDCKMLKEKSKDPHAAESMK